MALSKTPFVMLGNNKDDATVGPGVTNDNTEGYVIGSVWIDVTADKTYTSVDVSTGAAVWKETSAGGAAHAASHTDGSDDIQDATAAQKGVATAAQITKLDAIEGSADVTDDANVRAALSVATADIAINSKKITGLADGTGANDAINKTQLDAAINGLDLKEDVVVATTGNITLSGEQTIDTILTSASRVLVKDQSAGAENGIYVSSSGAWTRATDADVDAEVTSGMACFVMQGGQARSGWMLTTTGTITVGTTSLTFTQFNGLDQTTAGTGLSKSGNTLSVTAGGIGISQAAASIKPYDIAVNAGFGTDMTGADLVVQAYAELVMTRSGTFKSEAGYIDTVATGAAVIVDIEKNGVSIYTTKPQFAVSTNTLTAGTIKSDGTEDFVSGDRITFKVTQIGSTIAGQKLRFTTDAELT